MNPIIGMVAQSGINYTTGLLNDKRQQDQTRALNSIEEDKMKRMTEYNMMKQMEMWEKTGYVPTVDQMKRAGLNPALMYKGTGAGGSTQAAISSTSNASGTQNAPMGAPNVAEMAQLALLNAQKENIEADTENKKASAQNLGADTEGKGIENAFKSYMMSTSPDGKENVTIGESTRGQQEGANLKRTEAETKFKLDENEREALMNSKIMEKIGAEITKMAKEGKNLDEIYKNLGKQGLLLDAEIEWNKLDISGGNIGKFLTNIIKMALKPR